MDRYVSSGSFSREGVMKVKYLALLGAMFVLLGILLNHSEKTNIEEKAVPINIHQPSKIINEETNRSKEKTEAFVKRVVATESEKSQSVQALAAIEKNSSELDELKQLEELSDKVNATFEEKLLEVDGSIDALMYSEQYDNEWAPKKERLVTNFVNELSDSKYPSVRVVESICRMTICKYVVSANDNDATSANSELLQEMLASEPVERMQQVRVSFDDSGNRVYYLYRGVK